MSFWEGPDREERYKKTKVKNRHAAFRERRDMEIDEMKNKCNAKVFRR